MSTDRVITGVFALAGFNTVKWNNQALLGVKGLLISPFVGLFIAAIFTAVEGVGMAFGLWLYSKWRPLRLTIIEDEANVPGA